MHPYFLEKVAITLGVSGWATRSDKGRQPRQDTGEAIDIDTEMDETIEENTAGEPEKQSRPSQTNTLDFNFNSNSSGIESSIYNFTAQEVPRTPNTRISEGRVEASSPIQQSTQTAMAVPKSIRYLGTKKRKKATLLNTTRTPLRNISVNRRNTIFTIDIEDTESAFGSDTERMEVEMT
jgi:hypothetical protein